MKIALVCDWYLPRVGGIERQLSELASRLARVGHEVTVLTPCRAAVSNDPAVRVERVPALLLPVFGLAWTPTAFRRLGQRLRSGGFDVVHVHASVVSPTALAGTYYAQRAGLPAVCTFHSIWSHYEWMLRAADQFLHWTRWPVIYSAVSERVAGDLQPLIAAAPLDLLPNAIDPTEWQRPLQPTADAIHLVSVMRLAPRKRGPALLRAFAAVRARLGASAQVVLHLAGAGPRRGQLERLARRLGIADAVHFHGALAVAEVKTLLARCHVFVLAAELESFGLAALEARAAGLPIVAMRASGVAGFIVDGVNGLLAHDDAEFADHIHRLCVEPELRARLTANNQRTPIAFTWSHTLAAHFAIYAKAQRLRGLSAHAA